MEYCLNDQTISSKSYAEKSPPLQKTASELSIYICSKTLILPEWTIMRPFCCIPSCNGKSSWNLELSELSCGECWLIRQIDTTFPVTMVSYTEIIIDGIVFLYAEEVGTGWKQFRSARKTKEMQFLGTSLACICKSLFISRLQASADMVAKCL